MQEREHPQRAVGGDQVEIRHAPAEQRVPLAEVVVDVEPGQHPGDALARLVQPQEVGHGVT